jgi:hypothetical protein
VKSEEFVLIPVPKSMAMEVYRLLGAAPPAELMADPAIIQKAYEESSPAMKAFLDLLSERPDKWLTIDEIRDELGMKTHQLPGVLSTFPRRWRGRYRQSGPMPFDVEGKGSRRRYRLRQEVAELISSVE